MSEEDKKILTILVDTSSVVHRNFHGYPSKPGYVDGEEINVNTLYGYIKYITRIHRDFNYDNLIHVLDPEGGSDYRKSIYPEYKGQRPPTDPELVKQKQLLTTVLDAFSQKWVMIDGVESDDVLASYAKKLSREGHSVLILTPDKDLLQIVEDGAISIAKYVKSKTGNDKVHDCYTELGVYNKFGVHPYQVADFLALIGDVSDNIIGVHGVGEKKAAQLLSQYGDIETIITHANEIKGVLGKNVRDAVSILPLSKKLTLALKDITVPEINDITVVRDKALNNKVRKWIGAEPYWTDDLTDNPNTNIEKEENSYAYQKSQYNEDKNNESEIIDELFEDPFAVSVTVESEVILEEPTPSVVKRQRPKRVSLRSNN